MSYEKPFAGLKVVDLSQGVAGPYAGMMLAQYGADVIKVEPTGEGGDWSRGLGVRYDDQTAYSIPANLGKRSIALDLKHEDGRAVLWKLVQGADVFMQGFRPGVIERLGFGYPDVSEREPRIIYLSISGFGQTGPLAERPAMDPVLQAYTGLTAENNGADGLPHRIPIIAIDMSTAIYAYSAIATALFARQHEPRGRHIEASLLQGAASLQVVRMMTSYLEGGTTPPSAPPSGIHETRDGWINITLAREHEWVAFCTALEVPSLPADARFRDRDGRRENEAALLAIIRPLLGALTFRECSEKLAPRRIMHEQLNSYTEFLKQPHVAACGAVAWVDHPGVAQPVPMPNLIGAMPFESGAANAVAPALGQHSVAILREHGFDEREIARLTESGAVQQG
jgi:crotonobetainyl-CoA:carnitine CoA-transferase CaiB-like acyl-CoA transferase